MTPVLRPSIVKWLLPAVAAAAGLAVGLGAYTFVAARGYAYLTNDPAACANCHVMGDHFAAWEKSTHRAVAGCNDCHAPHDNIAHKYFVKAENGFVHSLNFTTGRYPDPLRIREANRRVTQAACLHCHAAITAAITPGSSNAGHASARSGPLNCIGCHTHVGHWVR